MKNKNLTIRDDQMNSAPINKKSMNFMGLLTAILLMICCSHRNNDAILEQYVYDSEGRLITRITPDDKATQYNYNDQGLLKEIIYPKSRVQYGYDKNGNRIWMQDPTGTTEYYYDAFDRLIGVISKHSPWRLIWYEYDPWGYLRYMAILNLQMLEQELKYRDFLQSMQQDLTLRQLTWPEYEFKLSEMLYRLQQESAEARQRWFEYEVKYNHDLAGNIKEIITSSGPINYFLDAEKNQVKRGLPNGITTFMTYSPERLLESIRHEDRAKQLIAEYRYKYNAAGKVVKVEEETLEGIKTTGFEWDTRGYLKNLLLPNGQTQSFAYDAMGNRILEQDQTKMLRYDYDPLGRLVRAGDLEYEWDQNSNLITQTEKQLRTRLQYDDRKLLSLAMTPQNTVQYTWDGDDNLLSRDVGMEFSQYLQNPLAPPGFTLAEYDRNNRLTSSYIYGDVLLGQRDMNGQMQFFLEDGFNSIRNVVDMNGRIVGQRDYTPFAKPIIVSGDFALNFRTAGERFLTDLKNYAISGRFYDPLVGRYQMPTSFPEFIDRFDSFNKYAHGCGAAGNFAAPRCNQTKKGSSYLEQNHHDFFIKSYGTYVEDALKTGWGSGAASDEDLLKQAKGRFGIIDVAGDPAGLKGDIPNTLLNDPLQARSPQWSAPYFSKNSWHHSRGNVIGGQYENRRQLDPSRLGALPLDNTIQGIVSDLSSIEPYLGERMVGLQFRGKSDNILVAGRDAVGNIFRFLRGVGKLGAGIIVSPIKGEGPFASHALEELFNRVPEEWDLPSTHSYDEVLIIRRHSDGSISQVSKWQWDEQSWKWHLIGISQNIPTGIFERRQFDNKRRDEEDDDDNKGLPSKGPDWPGGGGPGGPPPPGGGSGAPGGSGSPLGKGGPFNDPFTSVERQLGGIKLDATAQFFGDIGSITGAVYDPEKQCVVLLGERDISLPVMKPEDLAIALYSVFGSNPQDLAFSLDPADPANPRGKWLKAVYIPEEILAGTSFGQEMFEADWLLKQYSFGVRIDSSGKSHERKSLVQGFKSTADLAFEAKGGYDEERWARFWIVADDMDNDD